MNSFKESFMRAYDYLKNNQIDLAWNSVLEAEKNYNYGAQDLNISKEDLYILKGTIALSNGDIINSELSFEESLKENPDSIEGAMGIGKVFYSKGMKKEAADMFEWVLKNDPENLLAQSIVERINQEIEDELEIDYNYCLEAAREYYINNDNDAVIEILNYAENKYRSEIFSIRGDIELNKNELLQAEKFYKEALKLDPLSSNPSNGLAEVFLKKKDYESAKTMLEATLTNNPEDQFAIVKLSEINEMLGYSELNRKTNFIAYDKLNEQQNSKLNTAFEEYGKKNYKLALDYIDLVINEVKDFNFMDSKELQASLFNFKGFVKLAMTDLSEANLMFEVALKANPESSQACAGLAEVAYLNTEDEKAKMMYEWAIKNNPQNIFAINGLAKVNKVLGYNVDHNSLEKVNNEFVSEEFNNHIEKAYADYGDKKYEEALDNLLKADMILSMKNNKKDFSVIYSRLLNFKGFCYLSLNDINNAESVFVQALELNPKSSQACAGLGEVLYLQGNDEGAKEMFEFAIKNEPLNKFAIAGLEKVYSILGVEPNDKNNKKNIFVENVNDLITRAYEYFSDKYFGKAIELLKEAEIIIEKTFEFDERQESISTLNNFLGFNYLGLYEYEAAQICFEKSLEINPQSSQACAGLGEILFFYKNDEAAKQMFEWAIKNNKFNNYAIQGLAKVNKELGLPDDDNSLN